MTVALIFYVKEWAKKRKGASPEKRKKMPETKAKKWWKKMSNEFDAENEIGVGGTLQVDTPQQPPQQESKTGSQISMFEESSAKSETAAKPATYTPLL